jgi:hypothetical protein
MNCKEFEEMVNDLACEHLMLASKRVQALTHKEVCTRCAARLAEERLLTERLRLLADAEVVETPARVKASLMAAFAEHNGISTAPAAAEPVKLEPVHLRQFNSTQAAATNRWWRWQIAAAAAILILLSGVTIALLNGRSPINSAPHTPSSAEHRQTPAPKIAPPDAPKAATNQALPTPSVIAEKDGLKESTGKSQGGVQLAEPRTTRKAVANRSVSAQAVSQLAQNEVVTDYIPLTYLDDSTAFDSGLVVRVQVPRTTLISMGLPMNVENSSELVKADVVVGDDGVARAIRFVHDSSARTDGKQTKL